MNSNTKLKVYNIHYPQPQLPPKLYVSNLTLWSNLWHEMHDEARAKDMYLCGRRLGGMFYAEEIN